MKQDWWKLPVSIAISEAAGIIGTIFTIPAIPSWYAGLQKPPFSPPAWVFGPVWTILYLLIGIVLFVIWKDKNSAYRNQLLLLFWLQWFCNALWSFLFFGLRSPLLGMIDIVLLLGAILVWVFRLRRDNARAALILLPYVIWVAFATVLNGAILALNGS